MTKRRQHPAMCRPLFRRRQGDRLQHCFRNGVRCQSGETVGHRFRVAGRAQDAEDSAWRHRGEEVLEVDTDDDRTADVRLDERVYGTFPAEAVTRRVLRNAVENAGKDSPLEEFECALRCLEQAQAARGFRDPAVVVVAERFVRRRTFQRAGVGEPRERRRHEPEHLAKIGHRVQLLDRPPTRPHLRRDDRTSRPDRAPIDRLIIGAGIVQAVEWRRAFQRGTQLAWSVAWPDGERHDGERSEFSCHRSVAARGRMRHVPPSGSASTRRRGTLRQSRRRPALASAPLLWALG